MKTFYQAVLPQRCLGCARTCSSGICAPCLDDAERAEEGFTNEHLNSVRHPFLYTGVVRDGIRRLKYRGERQLALAFARYLTQVIPENAALVWVPTPRSRVLARGFDHCRLLTEAVAGLGGGRVLPLLERVGDPAPQVTLSPAERRSGPAGTIRSRMPSPRAVYLLDDVLTTGATLTEAAKACKRSGAEQVHAVCIARSIANSPFPRP